MPAFDLVVVVDWSAASAPSPARPSADAIWIGWAGAADQGASYHRTRAGAEAALRRIIAETPGRLLIGFDFPMGYPAGFARRLTGAPGAAAIWAWLAERIMDDPENRNNRFAVAAAINRQFGGAGPFWGCPAGVDHPGLGPQKRVDYAALGLAERRAVETRVPRAQPVWKLFTTGSVGSQALMGLPMIHRLSQGPEVAVWPFAAPKARVVLAEVYPSLLAGRVAQSGMAVKDEAQVRLLSQALYRLSRQSGLAPMFDTPPIAQEEGWILGAGHEAALSGALP